MSYNLQKEAIDDYFILKLYHLLGWKGRDTDGQGSDPQLDHLNPKPAPAVRGPLHPDHPPLPPPLHLALPRIQVGLYFISY